ncbi:MAG: hypothetical protein ACPGXL_01785 [Chitinophagales bacterium]
MSDSKNPFKKIQPKEDLPPEHKGEVIDSMFKAKFLLEIAELFTIRQVSTNGAVLDALFDAPQKVKKSNKK